MQTTIKLFTTNPGHTDFIYHHTDRCDTKVIKDFQRP